MSDLDKLIEAAEKEQREKTQAPGPRARERGARAPRKHPALGWIAALMVMAALIWGFGHAFLPISDTIVRADLNDALDVAQSAVEAYHAVNDVLPERVPLAALSRLVVLDPTGGGAYNAGEAFAGQIFNTAIARGAVSDSDLADPLNQVVDTGSGLLADFQAAGGTVVDATGRHNVESGGMTPTLTGVEGNLVKSP